MAESSPPSRPAAPTDLPLKGGANSWRSDGEQPNGRLSENILYFARALRAAGIPVGPGAVIDALEAVKAAGVGTREVHDALKRRCLYHWVGYPSAERELNIVRAKVPGVGKKLSEQVVAFVQSLRKQDLFKSPGVAETLDWAGALSELDVVALDPATVSDTLGVLLKYQDDIARLEGGKVKELLDEVKSELRAAE